MPVSPRSIALTAITATAVGLGLWATLRYLVEPGPMVHSPTGTATAPAGPLPEARRIKATLFYVASSGLRLSAAERDVLFADGPSEQGKRIVEAMIEPPPAGLVSAIPPGTTLRGLYLGEHGDAYVDFGSGLRTNHPGGSDAEILTVYAIVSALTVNLPAITSVQILIDGHEVDTLAGHVDLRRPLANTRQWMERGTS
jgi:hypothetical protein